MIKTLLVVAVLAVLACLAVIGLYVVPFIKAVDMAERRGLSTTRFGTIALLLALVSAGLLLKARSHGVLLVPAVLLAWAGPALVALLGQGQRGFGRQGAHES